MVTNLELNPGLWQQLLEHLLNHLPEEACGFLAGKDGKVSAVLPIGNNLHSPVRFEMDPQGQIQAMIWMEDQGLEMLAIFHSHPNGPPVPSPTDLAAHSYPDALCLVVSPAASGLTWQGRAFWMKNFEFEELPITIGV